MLDGNAQFHDDRYRFGGLTLVGVLVSDQPLENTVGALGAVMTSRNSNGVWDAWQLLSAPNCSLRNDGGFTVSFIEPLYGFGVSLRPFA